MYNPDTDSYHLVYPTDDHEEWLPFSEVVKLLPKSWARDEEQATFWLFVTMLRFLPRLLLTRNSRPIQPRSLLHNDQGALVARVLWKAALDLEYHTLKKMGCWRVVRLSTLAPGVKPITCKWVQKLTFVKEVYEKHTARIVSREFKQPKGLTTSKVCLPPPLR